MQQPGEEQQEQEPAEVDPSEAYLLVLHWLSAGPCQAAAQALLREVQQHSLLPRSHTATGGSAPTPFQQLLQQHARVPPTALLQLLAQSLQQAQRSGYAGAAGITTLLAEGPLAALPCLRQPCPPQLPRWAECRRTLEALPLPQQQLLREAGVVVRSSSSAQRLPLRTAAARFCHHATFRGHGFPVFSVLYDQQGSRIVTGADDANIKIWSVQTGLLLVSARGHSGEISDLSLSCDGQLLASGATDGEVRVWSMRDSNLGQNLAVLRGHTAPINLIGYHPRLPHALMSASSDGSIRLWDASDQHVAPIVLRPAAAAAGGADGAAAAAAAAAAAGGAVAAGGAGARAEDAAPQGVGDEEDGESVPSCAWSPDGTHLVAGSTDGNAYIWRWDVGSSSSGGGAAQQHAQQQQQQQPPLQGQEQPGHQQRDTAAAAAVEPLHAADWAQPVALPALRGHTQGVWLSEFSHSGTMLATGSMDGTVRVWRLLGSKWVEACAPLLLQPLPQAAAATGVGGAGGGAGGAAAGSGAAAPAPRQRQRKAQAEQLMAHKLVWVADDSRLLAAGSDHVLRVWDTRDWTSLQLLQGHSDKVHVLCAHPHDARLVLSAAYDGLSMLWDVQSSAELRRFSSSDTPPLSRGSWAPPVIQVVEGRFAPDGNSFVVSDVAGQFSIYGLGPPPPLLLSAPYDQFFSRDYDPIVHDTAGFAAYADPDTGVVIAPVWQAARQYGLEQQAAGLQQPLCDNVFRPYPPGFQAAYRAGRVLDYVSAGEGGMCMRGSSMSLPPSLQQWPPTVTAAVWKALEDRSALAAKRSSVASEEATREAAERFALQQHDRLLAALARGMTLQEEAAHVAELQAAAAAAAAASSRQRQQRDGRRASQTPGDAAADEDGDAVQGAAAAGARGARGGSSGSLAAAARVSYDDDDDAFRDIYDEYGEPEVDDSDYSASGQQDDDDEASGSSSGDCASDEEGGSSYSEGRGGGGSSRRRRSQRRLSRRQRSKRRAAAAAAAAAAATGGGHNLRPRRQRRRGVGGGSSSSDEDDGQEAQGITTRSRAVYTRAAAAQRGLDLELPAAAPRARKRHRSPDAAADDDAHQDGDAELDGQAHPAPRRRQRQRQERQIRQAAQQQPGEAQPGLQWQQWSQWQQAAAAAAGGGTAGEADDALLQHARSHDCYSSWLASSSAQHCPPALQPYVPQVGDAVVYLCQEHRDCLQHSPHLASYSAQLQQQQPWELFAQMTQWQQQPQQWEQQQPDQQQQQLDSGQAGGASCAAQAAAATEAQPEPDAAAAAAAVAAAVAAAAALSRPAATSGDAGEGDRRDASQPPTQQQQQQQPFQLRPAEPCQVLGVEYVVLPGDDTTAACLTLQLSDPSVLTALAPSAVHAAAAAAELAGLGYAVDAGQAAVAAAAQGCFQVLLPLPTAGPSSRQFVLLQPRFVAAVRHSWRVGDAVQVLSSSSSKNEAAAAAGVLCKGTVTAVASAADAEAAPSSTAQQEANEAPSAYSCFRQLQWQRYQLQLGGGAGGSGQQAAADDAEQQPPEAAAAAGADAAAADSSWYHPWELLSPDSGAQGTGDAAAAATAAEGGQDQEASGLSADQAAAMLAAIRQWRERPGVVFGTAPSADARFVVNRRLRAYNRVIPLPLGLADIEARVSSGAYRSLQALLHDAALIASNTAAFYGPGSKFSTLVQQMYQDLAAAAYPQQHEQQQQLEQQGLCWPAYNAADSGQMAAAAAAGAGPDDDHAAAWGAYAQQHGGAWYSAAAAAAASGAGDGAAAAAAWGDEAMQWGGQQQPEQQPGQQQQQPRQRLKIRLKRPQAQQAAAAGAQQQQQQQQQQQTPQRSRREAAHRARQVMADVAVVMQFESDSDDCQPDAEQGSSDDAGPGRSRKKRRRTQQQRPHQAPPPAVAHPTRHSARLQQQEQQHGGRAARLSQYLEWEEGLGESDGDAQWSD